MNERLLEVNVNDVLHEPVDAELKVVSLCLQHHQLPIGVQLLQSQVVLRVTDPLVLLPSRFSPCDILTPVLCTSPMLYGLVSSGKG